MIEITIYSRDDCHLCDKAIADLAEMQGRFPHRLNVINVNHDTELNTKYGTLLPVVEIGSLQLNAPFDKKDLQNLLGSAIQNHNQRTITTDIKAPAKRKDQKSWSRTDRFTWWFSHHYLMVFNFLVLLYIGLPFFAPVFLKAGYEKPAILIYRAYGLVCHQLAFRSFFLFGEQPVYPREAAHVDDLISFSNATGLGEGNSAKELFASRRYFGDDEVGYKVALCQRDIAIYGAILFFGILYGLTGRRLPPLPWYFWLLFGLIPIGLDGISQIISQPPLNLIPYRESTPLFRSATGVLFGFTTAWFGFPLVEETMRDTRQMLKNKHKHLVDQTIK